MRHALILLALLSAPAAVVAQRPTPPATAPAAPAPARARAARRAAAIPSPESVFGFEPGADYKLATYDQSIAYFKKLAAASACIRLVEAGRTSEGRVMYFALISTPENLANIDRYREIGRRLAHPQGLSEADARRLAAEGKALIHLDGGLHSTEVAGPQQTPLLAYDLVRRATDADMKPLLDKVIVMLWPTINPDGQQIVAEWYMKNVGTPYELSPLPRLYQDFVGHDNNRDAYMLNMIESRVLEHTWRDWEPQIVYTQHQSGPFPTRIWLPPFSEPVGIEVPFVVAREVNMIGMAIAKGLEERGQIGATHMGTAFDAWYPGYVDYTPNYKNIAAFWTETALYQYATPHTYTLEDFPASFRDLRPRSLYSSPWPPGLWRLRDAVDYMETGSLSVIEWAAKYKDDLLLDRYKGGMSQIKKGETEPPYAYVVPQQQRDPVAAVELLRRLAFSGVRVSQLAAPASIDGTTYPAGTWIVPTDQEFAGLAREVLDIQHYPDLRQYPGGPPERPYDAAGWTLPLQMGVTVVAAKTPLGEDARRSMKQLGPPIDPKQKPTAYNIDPAAAARDAAPFDSVPGIGFDASPAAAAIVPPAGHVTGTGDALALDPAQNNTFRAINRAWNEGATVAFDEGKYIVSGLSKAAQDALVDSLALVATRTQGPAAPGPKGPGLQSEIRGAGPSGPAVLRRPRIGVYDQWAGGSMDAGWTRWLLDQYGFSYVTLRPEDFHGRLADKVDVIVFGDDARVPLADTPMRTPAGAPAGGGFGRAQRPMPPPYAYALTAEDLRGFEQFVRDGGRVVCLNNGSNFAIQQLKLPVKNVVASLKPEEFYLRGTIVQVIPDRADPVMAGLDETAAVFADSSPVFDTEDGFAGSVLARYADSGSPLLSGFLIGENYMHGKAAALDVRLDRGHVILLGFRPEWRGQSFGTFKVLFNALLAP